MILYHITSNKNIASIRKNGLQSRKGRIFLFDEVKVTDYPDPLLPEFMVSEHIALNQVCLFDKFAMFKIDTDKIGEDYHIETENVGEWTTKYQYLVTGLQRIAPEAIEYVGVKKVRDLNFPMIESAGYGRVKITRFSKAQHKAMQARMRKATDYIYPN